MNRNLLVPVMTIAAAAFVAFGVTRWQARAAAGPLLDRLQDSAWLTRALELTPAQAEAIARLKSEYREAVESCCERHCAARMEIGGELFSEDWTPDKQEALAEQLCKAQLDTEIATIEHMRRVHQLLTPVQQKKYEQLVQSCFCESCPNDLHNK